MTAVGERRAFGVDAGIRASASAFAAWLAVTSMLVFAPSASADQLLCEVSRDGSPDRYLINIDDRQDMVTVVDPDSDEIYPVNVGELRPERVLFTFNSLRMDATEFVRDGKVVTMSLATHADALLDRSTNSYVEIGYVTDDKGRILSLDDLREMQTEEEAWIANKKDGPKHNPMFWLLLQVATYRHEGVCRAAPSDPGH